MAVYLRERERERERECVCVLNFELAVDFFFFFFNLGFTFKLMNKTFLSKLSMERERTREIHKSRSLENLHI